MKKVIGLCCALALFAACQSGTEKASVAGSDTLAYTYDSVKVYSKHITGSSDTAKASISFPVFKTDTLNKLIKRRVFDFVAEEEPATSYQDIVKSFIKGYDDFALTNKDTPQSWFLIIKINVLKQSPDYLSLKSIHSDYVGGAHGMTIISFLNYNPKTNSWIKLDSLIKPGKMTELTKIAETIFRKNEKLSSNETLEGKYFFDKDKFALAQTFYVSDKGLVFLYNPYEIKPYAAGYTELIVPFAALKNVAKPNTILTPTP